MPVFIRKSNVKEMMEEILDLPALKVQIQQGVRNQFEHLKNKLLQNFDEHPVTQEVGNPSSENISNTLNGVSHPLDGDGNLYGFLGIPAGSETVEEVRGVLERQVKIKGRITINKRTHKVTYRFSVPDLKDFSSAARLEWDTKNWVEGIERGLSGFQYFMNVKKGRSGQGIQVRAGIRGGQFKNRKYMSQLLNDFKQSF